MHPFEAMVDGAELVGADSYWKQDQRSATRSGAWWVPMSIQIVAQGAVLKPPCNRDFDWNCFRAPSIQTWYPRISSGNSSTLCKQGGCNRQPTGVVYATA